MSEPSHATRLTGASATDLELLEPVFPLFLQLLRPLNYRAPHLLADPVLMEPLYAALLIDVMAFRNKMTKPFDPEEMPTREIAARLTDLHENRSQKNDTAIIRYTTSDMKKHPFWPVLEPALYKLIPRLANPLQNPTKNFARIKIRGRNVRLYLATVMLCVKLARSSPH